VLFDCSFAQVQHHNTFRQIIGTDLPHERVNTIALRSYFSAYQAPSLHEGFDDIVRANFVPEFANDEHRRIFGMYLTEK